MSYSYLKKSVFKSPITKACGKTWSDQCSLSSTHGMKYINDGNARYHIRIIWAIIVFTMFILAGRLAYSLYGNFLGDPTRFIIESDHEKTARLFYPAVTICPSTLFNHSKAEQIIMKFNLPENLTVDDILQSLSQAHGLTDGKFKYDKHKIATIQTVLRRNNYTAAQLIKKIVWNFDAFFFRCRLQSKTENCSNIFRVTMTHRGFCSSFNTQNDKYLIPSKQFKANRHGIRYGLSVILTNDQKTNASTEHFQVLIHESYLYPDKSVFTKVLHNNEELLLRIKPTQIISSREVWRRLEIDERKCALPREISLRYFSMYRFQNCVFECQNLNVRKQCGCVPVGLNRETKIVECDIENIPCLSDNYDRYVYTQSKCKCMESCEKINLALRLTRTNFEYSSSDTVDAFYTGIKMNFTVIHIYIHSQMYRRIRRDIVWNLISIVGNLGNSYSVFVGMSAISALQCLYYLTIVLSRNCNNINEIEN